MRDLFRAPLYCRLIELTENIYVSDEYIDKNPTLHEEDSAWKIGRILPFVTLLFEKHLHKKQVNLLDVGGGAGLILNAVATHIKKIEATHVNTYALDLSSGMLKVQRKHNPDLNFLNEDIRKTSLRHKSIDLALMIDVLEHVPEPEFALLELRRIANYVIFKVPMEGSLTSRAWNFFDHGKHRKELIENLGHVNLYSLPRLLDQIETCLGHVLVFNFTNEFEYTLLNKKLDFKDKARAILGNTTSKVNSKLCSLVFGGFIILLVQCYPEVFDETNKLSQS